MAQNSFTALAHETATKSSWKWYKQALSEQKAYETDDNIMYTNKLTKWCLINLTLSKQPLLKLHIFTTLSAITYSTVCQTINNDENKYKYKQTDSDVDLGGRGGDRPPPNKNTGREYIFALSSFSRSVVPGMTCTL